MKSSSSSKGSSAKLERKTVEKNRRIHMKGLCLKLSALIPKEHLVTPNSSSSSSSKDAATQLDHLGQAAAYITKLREKIEKLKQRRDLKTSIAGINKDISSGLKIGFPLPVVEVRHQHSNLEVVLISGLKKRFKFHEVISVLEEEGAEVVNASFSVVGDKVFHTVHSQVGSSIKGLEASRLTERLKELIQ